MMATLRQLKRKAAQMGYEMTPTLEAELTMLAAIPDAQIKAAFADAKRKAMVDVMAKKFQVPKAAMEQRLGAKRECKP